MTFDVVYDHAIFEKYEWQKWFEAFCICRHCSRATTFVLKMKEINNKIRSDGVATLNMGVNDFVTVEGYVNISDLVSAKPPEHVPKDIADAFREGATCLSVGCYNAAAAMFRLCVDLATKSHLPQAETPGLNAKTRRDLGLRLPWLFDHGVLHESLRELSTCIKEDGNDGVHAGTLNKADAEDLLDFTVALLERLYTEPERLRLAQERRAARRKPQ